MSNSVEIATKDLLDTLSLATPASFGASLLWSGLHNEMRSATQFAEAEAKDAIGYVTKFGCFTFPRSVQDGHFERISGRYLRWLECNGHSLQSFPPYIEESPLVAELLTTQIEGRSISTMFLLHLCMSVRLAPLISDGDVVVEIGGGYGGLARLMKLLKPRCTYVIIDLPDSLFYSHIFLRETFGDNILYVKDAKRLSNADLSKYDIVLVPTIMKDCLKGVRTAVALNTISLGEMNQATIYDYMSFVQYSLVSSYFYTINRYGNFPFSSEMWPRHAPRITQGANNYITTVLDPDWDVLIWDLWGETSFQQLEDCSAPYLELLLKRKTEPTNETTRKKKAHALFQTAIQRKLPTGLWHYYMWDSIRLFPAKSSLEYYCKKLIELSFPEVAYFSDLKTRTSDDFGKNMDSLGIQVGTPPYPDKLAAVDGEHIFAIEEKYIHLMLIDEVLTQKNNRIADLEQGLSSTVKTMEHLTRERDGLRIQIDDKSIKI